MSGNIDEKGKFIDLGEEWGIEVDRPKKKEVHYPSLRVKTNADLKPGKTGTAVIKFEIRSFSKEEDEKPEIRLEVKSIKFGKQK